MDSVSINNKTIVIEEISKTISNTEKVYKKQNNPILKVYLSTIKKNKVF